MIETMERMTFALIDDFLDQAVISRWRVTGIVQGVGFRPFCARLARELALGGGVRNTPRGAEIELRGTPGQIAIFFRRLQEELPPLARMDAVIQEDEIPLKGDLLGEFIITESASDATSGALLPPDVATCSACLIEMKTPFDRRFRYPFTNCTNCGPRFSIVESLPYDRPRTTMRSFPLCPHCEEEYHDPTDRRYHAQPIACPICGPRLRWTDLSGTTLAEGEEALRLASEALVCGKIVAVKGLGGYHLVCDAGREEVVGRLRRVKGRPHRPLALMVRDVATAESLVVLRPEDRDLLRSPQAPILLAPARSGGPVAPSVAPEQSDFGVMLPYTPLHHLLLESLPCCVFTSANASGEALVAEDHEALDRLGGMADFWLAHDRPIRRRVDDSVLRTWKGGHLFVRRSRGFAPAPLRSPKELPTLCAAGGEMKSTFALTQGRDVFLSPYLGHLRHLSAAELYRETLGHFRDLFSLHPRLLVHDSHPQYLSTQIAREIFSPEEEVAVQHHHAHFASVLWEKGWEGPALGVIFDGTGYGDDGTVWGGEFFIGDRKQVQRMASLVSFPLLGGDRAVEEPWRSALALARESLGKAAGEDWVMELWPHRQRTVEQGRSLGDMGFLTTSCGRWLDGVAALMGGPEVITYDGQGPMEMESWAWDNPSWPEEEAPFSWGRDDGGVFRLDWRPAVRWLREMMGDRVPRPVLARGILRGLVSGIMNLLEEMALPPQAMPVVLSGGVWQNRFLLEETVKRGERRGYDVWVPRLVSPNDEGIALGQVAVAAARRE